MQTGNVAVPDCLSTFGLLGAESSFSTLHFAEPLPVWVAVQPGGGAPGLRSSKLMVSARAVPDNRPALKIAALIRLVVFMLFVFCAFLRCCWKLRLVGSSASAKSRIFHKRVCLKTRAILNARGVLVVIHIAAPL